MQKLRRIRAALSASSSSVMGQKASAPSLLESLLTGLPTLWNQSLLVALVLSHDDFFPADGCDADMLAEIKGRPHNYNSKVDKRESDYEFP